MSKIGFVPTLLKKFPNTKAGNWSPGRDHGKIHSMSPAEKRGQTCQFQAMHST